MLSRKVHKGNYSYGGLVTIIIFTNNCFSPATPKYHVVTSAIQADPHFPSPGFSFCWKKRSVRTFRGKFDLEAPSATRPVNFNFPEVTTFFFFFFISLDPSVADSKHCIVIMTFFLWIPASFARWIRLKIYQYEVTFAVYMLTPTEKFIFSMLREKTTGKRKNHINRLKQTPSFLP